MKRVELGCPGHFIAADNCKWRRHTQVGKYRVSTVGEYRPGGRGERDRLGGGEDAFFETMVFRTLDKPVYGNEGCGCRELRSLSPLDTAHYATAGEAQAGHERLVAKYEALS